MLHQLNIRRYQKLIPCFQNQLPAACSVSFARCVNASDSSQCFASTRLILHMALLFFQKRRLANSTCTRDRASVFCARSSELTKAISSGVILPEQSNSHQPSSELTCSRSSELTKAISSGVILPEQSNSHQPSSKLTCSRSSKLTKKL